MSSRTTSTNDRDDGQKLGIAELTKAGQNGSNLECLFDYDKDTGRRIAIDLDCADPRFAKNWEARRMEPLRSMEKGTNDVAIGCGGFHAPRDPGHYGDGVSFIATQVPCVARVYAADPEAVARELDGTMTVAAVK